jgi:hypothetical protein
MGVVEETVEETVATTLELEAGDPPRPLVMVEVATVVVITIIMTMMMTIEPRVARDPPASPADLCDTCSVAPTAG